MSATNGLVKGTQRFAPLKNVSACYAMVQRLIERPFGTPGIGVMYSPSGYGKTQAGIYAKNSTHGIIVAAADSWNRKTLLQSILLELGVPQPKGTVADLARQSIEMLGNDIERPLIIDEADKLVDKNMVELVREIHEHSQAPVLLIGEEMLPKKLERIERMHNRVLEWLPAQECDLEDTRKLATVFLGKLQISDDMLEQVRDKCGGRARRIVTTFHNMTEWARNTGAKTIDADYNGPIHTGRTPQLRKVRAA